jgi:hypothetical protein
MITKDKFKSLRADLDAIVDKELAYEQIKQRIWPLANNKKPTGYLEFGDKENADKKKAKENRKKTMEMNHYVKSYLALIK